MGGLSWQTTEESLRWHFEQYGNLTWFLMYLFRFVTSFEFVLIGMITCHYFLHYLHTHPNQRLEWIYVFDLRLDLHVFIIIISGPVSSVEVMRDRVTGDPRGFAFVVFQNQDTVDLVMAEAKHEINHKVVDVKRAQARGVAPPSIHESKRGGDGTTTTSPTGGMAPETSFGSITSNSSAAATGANTDYHTGGGGGVGGAPRHKLTPEQQGNKIFVGGIPHHIDRDELKRIFEQFGPVVDSIIMMDQVQRRSRGFGFVTFEDGSQGAQKAIDAQPLNIQGRLVEVKLATPKADQKRFPPAAGPKNVGLRAGMISSSSGSSSGEYAGLAVSFGRSGWRAGYGTKAFGAGGWKIQGWEEGSPAPEKTGFSFDMLGSSTKRDTSNRSVGQDLPPPAKRTRY